MDKEKQKKKVKKRSTLSWIMEFAGSKRSSYAGSVLLAIFSVVSGFIPYIFMANIVRALLENTADLHFCLTQCLMMALFFVLDRLFHAASTTMSHKATFEVLANIRRRLTKKLAIVLGVVKAIFAALRITAIAVVVQGLIDGQMTMKHFWLSLGIMVISVLGQFLINLKTTMLQCEAGYHSCAQKRIEIAEHLRYLPMGFFNRNSLGMITNVTTNTMESLADIATRIVMITTQGILTTLVITCFVYAFDWRIGLVLSAGIVLYIIFNHPRQEVPHPL